MADERTSLQDDNESPHLSDVRPAVPQPTGLAGRHFSQLIDLEVRPEGLLAQQAADMLWNDALEPQLGGRLEERRHINDGRRNYELAIKSCEVYKSS